MSLRPPRRNQEQSFEQLLAAIVDSASDALISINAQGEILTWNRAAEKLLGFEAWETLGQSISLILPPEQAQCAIVRSECTCDVDAVRLSKSGTRVNVSLTVNPLRDQDGDLLGYGHVLRPALTLKEPADVIEATKQDYEQATRRSHDDLRQFAFAAAHDLQEPLRNVSTCISMLKRQYGSILDEGALEWINASVEGAQRLHEMVKDLLNYSTVLDVPADAKLFSDTAATFQEVLANLAPALIESGAEVRIRSAPPVAVEGAHLAHLLRELIGNALKYRRRGIQCVIEVTAERLGDFWHMIVQDNGIGFDPAYSDRIFGVFKRLHQRDRYAGNGIGLAICERIVRHYRGRIWAQGQPESGATFHFLLPAVDPAPSV